VIDTITFIVGGQSYAVGPMVLDQIERAEPLILEFGAAGQLSSRSACRFALRMLSIALSVREGKRVAAPSDDDLALLLLPSEQGDVCAAATQLLTISGFVQSGEAGGSSGPAPQVGIASSPNSLGTVSAAAIGIASP
jgi:hypothetical protein